MQEDTPKDPIEVLDNLRDSYVEAGLDGVLSFANLAFIRELGYDIREEVLGKHFWQFVQEEFAAGVSHKLDTLYRSKVPLDHFKTRYVGRNGKSFIGEAALSPLLRNGELVGMKGTIRNVTRMAAAEKELAIQKDFMDALLAQTPVAVVNVSKDNKISFVNPAFQELFGYTTEELIGQNLDELLSTPDTLKEMREYSLNRLGERLYLSGKRKKKDGSMTDVEVIAQPFFVGSINYGHLVFYLDISERLRTEAALKSTATAHKAVLETLQDSYFEADASGFLTYVNQPFIRATKYEHKTELIGKHFRHLVARESRIAFFTEFKKLFSNNQPIKPFDFIYVTKEGEKFSSEIVASPVLENGKTIGTRGIIRDISIRVKAEELLKKAKEAAENRASELASINRVAERVSFSLNLQDILLTACQELCAIFPIYKAGIALLDKQDRQLEVMAFHSTLPEEESRQGKILFLDGEGCSDVQHLIKAKQTLRIRDAQGDPLIKPLHNLFGRSGRGPFMVVPLINRGQTLGMIGMTLKDSEFAFKRKRIELAETVASQIATAVENAKMHAQTEQALDLAERDLEIGREIQSGFFPPFLPEVPGWELAAYFKAARQVSGDFYDVFPIEHTPYVGLVVADVCDKGVGAALFMVLLRSLIRSYSEQHRKNEQVHELLQNIAVNVNRYIVQTHGQSNMFATLFLGILDPAENKLYYVNGGHDAPLLVDANGQLKNELLPTGPAFGFTTDLEFETGSCAFSAGDLLFSYTDGFTEAKNLKGDFYTDEQLVREASQAWPSAFSAIKHLELGVSSHMGEQVQFDDITLLALRRKQENEPDCHKLTQRAILPKLPLFRNFVAEACQTWGVDSSISENLQLAVDELCSNLIIHGYEGRGQGDIHLSLRKQQDALQVQLEDEGSSFDPSLLDPPELGGDIEDRKVGGLGVFLVRALVDDLHYEHKEGRNSLVLSIKI